MRTVQRRDRGQDPRDDPARAEAKGLGVRTLRELERELGELRRLVDHNRLVYRPPIWFGPFLRGNISGSATFVMRQLFETAIGTYTSVTVSPTFDVDARIIGGLLQSFDLRTAGTAQLVALVDGANKLIGGAEINDIATQFGTSSFAPGQYIDLPAGNPVDPRLLLTGFTPATHFSAYLLIELDTSGRRD